MSQASATLVCERCYKEETSAQAGAPRLIDSAEGVGTNWVTTLTGVICTECWEQLGKPLTTAVLDGQLIPEGFESLAADLGFEKLRDLESQRQAEERLLKAKAEDPLVCDGAAILIFCSPTSKREVVLHQPTWRNHYDAIEALVAFFVEAKALQDPRLETLLNKLGVVIRTASSLED